MLNVNANPTETKRIKTIWRATSRRRAGGVELENYNTLDVLLDSDLRPTYVLSSPFQAAARIINIDLVAPDIIL